MSSEIIRVLHIEIRGGIGGIETFLLNLYSSIDKEKVQFDFVTTSEKVSLEKKFTSMGASIYKMPYPTNMLKYYRELKKLIKTNNYNIVHIHKNSAANIIPFIVCKELGVKTIIAHAHNTAPIKGFFSTFLHNINKKRMLAIITRGFACSELAANWLYGKEYLKNNEVKILKNGINTKKFAFNEEVREKVRKKLNLEGEFVIGHVGRFMEQKNHEFLIDIFKSILEINPHSTLLLCGIGGLEDKIKEKVHRLEIEDKVKFLGNRTDINEIMQAMDVFVLPSLYEGLPVVGIEAQAAGLPLISSDKVSEELKITELVKFISLEKSALEWAEEICDSYTNMKRKDMREMIIKNGYDIRKTAEYLENFYLENN